MTNGADDPRALLERSLESERLHSAYLISGSGSEPREAALAFARGMVCQGGPPRPCEACAECRRSNQREEIVLDGTGKSGPLLRHVGDHPDLLWVERGANDTRVRIGQIRALQHALRLLEEPPPRTTLVLVAASSAGLLATVRSRCQRVAFRVAAASPLEDPQRGELVAKLEGLGAATLPDLLDWAEDYRGARAAAAEDVHRLLETGAAWLRDRVHQALSGPGGDVRRELDADAVLSDCRRVLDQRNANPQMVAERALFALHEVASR